VNGFVDDYFEAVAEVAAKIDRSAVHNLVTELVSLRTRQGRLFLLGVGGSAANCSHAVNDFRKLCGIEAYTPIDNVAELTARINDEGWDTTFVEWLKISRLGNYDAIMVLSVGGGTSKTSANIAQAVDLARECGSRILGIVGSKFGATAVSGHAVVVVPSVPDLITPMSESFQTVIWHCLVNHPLLRMPFNENNG
jgi:D-sedoheptulose 7-phosphate isomerase